MRGVSLGGIGDAGREGRGYVIELLLRLEPAAAATEEVEVEEDGAGKGEAWRNERG